jgi:hypothetical protein
MTAICVRREKAALRLRNPDQLRRGERCRLDPSPTMVSLLHADPGCRLRAD